jgi:hypothetical protein
MSTMVRRLGFGAAFATGLSLLALSATGMASLDGDLQAAAAQQTTTERVVLKREHLEPCHDHAVGRSEL